MKKETFLLKLVCINCGEIEEYPIPKRKVFEDYTPVIDIEGLPYRAQSWSGYHAPLREKREIVFCTNCKVPMLVKTPIAFNFIPPNIGMSIPQ